LVVPLLKFKQLIDRDLVLAAFPAVHIHAAAGTSKPRLAERAVPVMLEVFERDHVEGRAPIKSSCFVPYEH
jgi:hypothetical protein